MNTYDGRTALSIGKFLNKTLYFEYLVQIIFKQKLKDILKSLISLK